MHAVATLRGAWRTTLVLALLAGVAGGLVIGGWAAVRRGATSVDRFEEATAGADLTVSTCGPDGHFDLDAGTCADPYVPFAERDRIAAIPGVGAAGIGAIFPLWYSSPKLPEDVGGGVWAMVDDGFPTALGEPIVVAGRMFDPDAADEMLVTEDVVAASDIRVGDTVTVRGYPLAQGVDLQADPQGDPIEVRVVGVVRFPTDLSPQRSLDDVAKVDSNPLLTRAWYARHGQHLAAFSTAVFVRFDHGADPTAAIGDTLAGQQSLLTPDAAESDVDTVHDAVRYESGVVSAVTLAAALAAAVVVGLSIGRQADHEQGNRAVLTAIGMSRPQRTASAAIRAIPAAAGAAVIAGATAVVTSAWTPIGLARRAEVDPGVRLDAVPLAVGLPLVAAVVVLAFVIPTLRRRRVTSRAWGSSVGTAAAMAGCSPELTTGLVLAFPGGAARRASVVPVISGALAAAAVVAAAALVGGLDHTLADPVRYGATWDAVIDAPVSVEQERAFAAVLRADERLTDVAGQFYTEASIGGEVTLVHALDPVVGEAIAPVVVDGRQPVRPGEIALGGVTMRALGVEIGDSVPVELLSVLEPTTVEATVVGQAIINDGYSAEAGDGGLLTVAWARELVPGAFSPTFAVRMKSGITIDDLQRDYTTIIEAVPQKGLVNLRRIENLPWSLAVAVGVLAIGAMVHALTIGIRRARPQLATLRALGFTRRQLTPQRALERRGGRRVRRRRGHPPRRDRRPVGLAVARRLRRCGDRGTAARDAGNRDRRGSRRARHRRGDRAGRSRRPARCCRTPPRRQHAMIRRWN